MPHNTMPETIPFAAALAADYDNLEGKHDQLVNNDDSSESNKNSPSMVFTKMPVDSNQQKKISKPSTYKQLSFATRCNQVDKTMATGAKITKFGLSAKNKAKRPSFATRMNRPISINISSTAMSSSVKGETLSRVDADLEAGKYNIL